uniref:Hydroperoxide isomerase ALOXE3-like n=1 Tax=Sphaeramia orbicularis TaxID=375764 RepID=A0A672YF86_9TELE
MSDVLEFQVTVHTSPGPTCGTFSRLWLSLIGSVGETPPISVTEVGRCLLPGSTCLVQVEANARLGRLLSVRLRLEAQTGFPDLDWHCSRVEVCSPGGGGTGPEDPKVEVFLCDRWLRSRDGDVELRSEKCGTEKILVSLSLLCCCFRWRMFVDGAPHCVDLNSLSDLGPNLSYTHRSPPINLHYLKGFTGRTQAWTSFRELDMFFALCGSQNNVARFIQAHWKDDWYFGYQCLNGPNPLLLRRIHLLPANLSVTSDMLRPFLPEGSSLEQELQKGTIYLLDYEVLDGVPANQIHGKQSYLSAPLCLLHLNQQGQLLPIAIQLQQDPGPLNPVFLPSDPRCDWLLAKMWVHSADFQVHQLVSHYLKTHMMGELFSVATLRQLPEPHPLHQLLMPHVRTSMQINFQARATLLNTDGVFDKVVGCGLKALPVVLSRASARMRYRSLCVPDDVSDRGVDKLLQSFYAQDALRVWDALQRFVVRWVDLFYRGDDDVQQDSEVQHWIDDINTHGFTQDSGFPQSFQTKAELSKFITMTIFTCSALHAAVNFSQLDFALWMPNCPPSMLRPPPQVKGQVTEDDLLSYLPDVNSTCRVLTSLTLLSQPAVNYVRLCHYKEAVFSGSTLRRLVEDVQAELQAISEKIAERNRTLQLPYPYLSPERIENSVAI